jgi:hypothetical protein
MAKLGETTLRVLMKGQMGTRICSTFGQKQKWEHPYTIRKSAELNNFKKAIYTDELFQDMHITSQMGSRH